MAELIHTFTSGKMNKDLDERLVPNGEYRDALNLEIASSETSQVGAFQNIKGNLELLFKTFNPVTKERTTWAANEYITALTNPVCIGSKADENSDEVYWFIASEGISVIASYNTITKVTSPLIVDTQNILNFTSAKLITGINVLEGMLAWTDNQTEPKKITIKDWVGSTINFITHSKIYGTTRLFIESDITVIKKYPLQPPTITAFTVADTLNGTPININATASFSFTETLDGRIENMTPESGPQTISWLSQTTLPTYNIDDILIFTLASADSNDTAAIVRCSVQSILGSQTNQTGAIVTVLTVGTGAVVDDVLPKLYEVKLEQEEPFFEFRFARFGYRYKYQNNEISVFSPFTNPAFIPGNFDYNPKNGYNLGMTNNIRQLEISDFIPDDLPIDVEAVDILYKATNNSNVYIVDTFKPNDEQWANKGKFTIKTEIITSAVQSNQLLRPYDNVPRRALAQEVTANRLLYGNYTQNFNLLNSQLLPLQVKLTTGLASQTISNGLADDGTAAGINIAGNQVAQSVKSQRTYQLGVGYIDEYGRTTPVFTSANASYIISKDESFKSNQLIASINSEAPYYAQGKQFPYFKYYVKETSQEYYNICLDRFYDAEDGNIWLSFPSAERNKIDDETFLILKKEHANSNPVIENAKYKVIAIENEAPLYLKETKLSKGVMFTNFVAGGIPVTGSNEAWVLLEPDSGLPGFDETFGLTTRTESGLLLRVLGGNAQSNYYKISTFGLAGPNQNYVRITSAEGFGEDMYFTTINPDGSGGISSGLQIEISEVQSINKPEFTGRFFVKVNQDELLTSKIVAAANTNQKYVRKSLGYLYHLVGDRKADSFWGKGNTGGNNWTRPDAQGQGSRLFIDSAQADCQPSWRNTGTGMTVSGQMMLSFAGGYGDGLQQGIATSNPSLLTQLNQNGAYFRFIDTGNGISDPNGTVYRVTSTIEQRGTAYDCTNRSSRFDNYENFTNQYTRWTIKFEPVLGNSGGLAWDPTNPTDGVTPWTQGVSNFDNYFTGIEFLGLDMSNDDFTTDNPAIFETEPKEATELDIYYEIPGAYTKAQHGDAHTLSWFNCYAFGNGVESDRIRDDFNQPTISNGVKASAVLDEPYEEETRTNGIIFSQIFNSTSGVNGLNQFIQAESITKDVNPEYGSIQKLHSRDTNLVTLCENKSMKILANKDALFNADGSTNVTSNRAVLGQTITFQGEYGIATNPESFAEFGFRMYYTDANRGSVVRLSNDGITDVAEYGMHGFYSDNLQLNKTIIGSWDMEKKNYNVTLSALTPYWQQTLGAGQFDRLNKDPLCDQFVNSKPTTSTTISYKEDVRGWTSRKTYIPESGAYLNNVYYTFNSGRIWEHNANTLYNNFYGNGPSTPTIGSYYESSFNTVFNENPASIKGFKTLSYSGTDSKKYVYRVGTSLQTYSLAQISSKRLIPTSVETTKGWYTNSIITDLQEGQISEFVEKEGKYFNYIKGLDTFFIDDCNTNVSTKEFNVQGIGRAATITAPPITDFTVTTGLDATCFDSLIPITLQAQSFQGVEDTVGNFNITDSNNCSSAITFQLITDSTTGGVLALNATGSFTFTPSLNYNGSAGSFTVTACCAGLCSDPTQMSIDIEAVAEGPYFTTTSPAITGLVAGDVYTYNPIGIADPDHASTTLSINTVVGLPSWMNQPLPLNNGTGNWYIPNSTVTGGAGAIDFTLTVVDPDGNTGIQQIVGDTINAALLNLEFLVTTRGNQALRSYVDPVTGFVTIMQASNSSSHGCNRGTYRVVGNTTDIARAYVGNTLGTGYFDTFTLDANGFANSATGDVEGTATIPSAVAQGTTSTDLDSTAPYQKYITSTDAFSSQNRYNLITIDQATANTIVANTSGPNPEIVSFGLISDTFNAGGNLNTHGTGVSLQIFKSGVEIYSANQPNDSAVTINVLTGEIIPTP